MGKRNKKCHCEHKCEHCKCGHHNPNLTEDEEQMVELINLICAQGAKNEKKNKTLSDAMLADADLSDLT